MTTLPTIWQQWAWLKALTGSPKPVRATPRPAKPCALPGCEVLTDHRGGYCCPQHYQEHKERIRAREKGHAPK